jgi:beta-glucosidase
LSSHSIKADGNGTIKLTVPVQNTGKVDGTEVVQVYVRNPQDPNGPLMQLRGFARVDVKAGQSADAVVTLNAKSFEWFDEATNTVYTKQGKYELLYGNSSDRSSLKTVEVTVK